MSRKLPPTIFLTIPTNKSARWFPARPLDVETKEMREVSSGRDAAIRLDTKDDDGTLHVQYFAPADGVLDYDLLSACEL